ncbi:MAG: hypothetical protein WD872_00040 [Pirellulaceae bacterium]
MQVKKICVAALLAAIVVAGLPAQVRACPFCGPTSQTFSEEIATMDVAVIAKLVTLPSVSDRPGDEIVKATFQVEQVIKGDTLVKPGEKIETLYFGEGVPGKPFLVMGIDPPKLMWSTPLPLTDRAKSYLSKLQKLPKDGPERLIFFQEYLEDKDELLARDSYDEFARAPYEQVIAIEEQMDHDQLIGWIKSPDIPASRRRLYFVMLGVCGSEKDLPMLEEFMRSSDRKAKSGLDSLIACYLTIKGADGLPLVDELFLANPKADYADTYSAIMALRFHGSEGKVIEKKPLLASLHHLLARPELADLIVPDLARWEDWGAMDKLMELFRKADEKNSWVRTPVVNYLRACPLPRAKELLKECEKIDPTAVKRANAWFPTVPTAPAPTAEKASKLEFADEPAERIAATQGAILPGASGEVAAAVPFPVAVPEEEEVAAINLGAAPAAAIRQTVGPAPNLWWVVGVPWAVGLGLLVVQWSVLRVRRG